MPTKPTDDFCNYNLLDAIRNSPYNTTEVAELVGVNASMVSHYIRLRNFPTHVIQRQIGRVLRRDPNELFPPHLKELTIAVGLERNGYTERKKDMRKLLFSLTRKSAFLSLACIFLLNISVWAQDESLAPGINERFKQQPSQSIKQFDFTNRDLNQQKEILDACGLKPGMDVADIGAGSGVHVRFFAEKVLPEGKVYAVDIIQDFLMMGDVHEIMTSSV